MHGEVLSAAKYHVGGGCGTDIILMSSGFIPSDSKLNYEIFGVQLSPRDTPSWPDLHPLCDLNALLSRLTSSVVLVTSLSSFYLVYLRLTGL